MRKNIGIWIAALLVVFSLPQSSSAQSRRMSGKSNDTGTERPLTRLRVPDGSETEPAVEFTRFANDMNHRRVSAVGFDDQIPPLPESAETVDDWRSDADCCVECFKFWEHRDAVWGEYLYLRPRGADVIYATPVNGTLATSVPVGPQATTDFGFNSGFRIGGSKAIDSCSSFTTNYTWYQAAASDSVSLPGGGGSFLRADTVHPSTLNVFGDSLSAQAISNFNMQSVDLNYRAIVWGGDSYAVNYLIGVKYARIEQQFAATYLISGATNVNANVDFNGVGPRFGLEGERLLGNCGLLLYSKANVNFLMGSSSANYLQTNIFTGIQAQTGLRETRIVTVPEFELGGGWQSCNGCFRLTAGYYVAAWFNMMTTPEYLSTVRESPNSFERQVKTLTLDGLNVRAEWRF